jgi:hypothetical protein
MLLLKFLFESRSTVWGEVWGLYTVLQDSDVLPVLLWRLIKSAWKFSDEEEEEAGYWMARGGGV